MRFSWDDKNTKELEVMLLEGMSASQIAGVFGITRNAVIGKAHRKGLTLRGAPNVRNRNNSYTRVLPSGKIRILLYKNKPKNNKKHLARPKNNVRLMPSVPLAPVYVDDLKIKDSQRLSLLQLTTCKCKWPVGNPDEADFFFCGADTEGTVYCTAHAQRAYRVTEPRPRQVGKAHRLNTAHFR